MELTNLDSLIKSLTPHQKKYLLNKLKATVLGSISTEVVVCPCCNTANFKKDGNRNGIQKYRCKTTSKTFSYKSRTILSGIFNLQKLEELMDLMIEKNLPTLDEIQDKIGVSRKTAFDWRTKIMTAVYQEIDFANQIVEFDEAFFRLSRKGRQGMAFGRTSGKKLNGDNKFNVKVFLTYSRTTKRLELYASHMGRTSKQDIDNYLGTSEVMGIYSDKHPSIKGYCLDKSMLHESFLSKFHISFEKREVHTQTLNYYCRILGNFLDDHLRGVSTKYLQGYLNWFMFIENGKREAMSVKEVVMDNKVALDIFKQKEKEFQYFLKINGRNNYGSCNDRYYGDVA